MNISKIVRSAKCGVLSALVAMGLTATAAEPEAVQLWEGGPYWATCNVGDGATAPGDYGALYTFNDNKAADAAASLGDGWRLPTKDELKALISNCERKWETCKNSDGEDINGYRFTSKSDPSKSIFLPAAGCTTGSSRESAGAKVLYWSSTVGNPSSRAYRLYGYNDDNACYADAHNVRDGSHGLSVRAVKDPPKPPSVTVDKVEAGEPWSKVTVNYTLGGTDAATDYKVAFDVTAGGTTAGVTNAAQRLTKGAATKTIDTAQLFGKETVDTKAKVKVSLIAVKPKAN